MPPSSRPSAGSCDALARFEAIYHGALTGVMVLSDDGQIVDANPAMLEMLGLQTSEEVRTHIAEYLDPDEHQRVSEAVEELFAGNSNSLRIDTRLNRRDGSVVWVCASFSIVREPDGRPSFGIVMVQDDTERKAAEDALAAPVRAQRAPGPARRASPGSRTGRCSATGSSRRSRSRTARAPRWRSR